MVNLSHADWSVARDMIPVNNFMSVQFVTRACPLSCHYCNIVKSPLDRRPLTTGKDWIKVYSILDALGVSFNLILGNEPLVMGKELVELVSFLKGGTPYALYTTTPEPMWSKWKQKLIDAGLHGISCGIDYPKSFWDRDDLPDFLQDPIKKSKSSFESMRWVLNAGAKACQGTATMTSHNVEHFASLSYDLTESGIWFACNPLHWDTEWTPGTNKKISDKVGFDFFPPKPVVKDFVLQDKKALLERSMESLRAARDGMGTHVFNEDEQLDDFVEFCPNGNDWHCTRPNLISIDPDGYLRVCGYRRGKRCNEISIFDFEDDPIETTKTWLNAWYRDMLDCPGCMWSMWNSAERHDELGEEESVEYFGQHGNTLIDTDAWDKVNVGNAGGGVIGIDKPKLGFGIGRVKKSGEWSERKKEIEAMLDSNSIELYV